MVLNFRLAPVQLRPGFYFVSHDVLFHLFVVIKVTASSAKVFKRRWVLYHV
jgi:hypothetical protein